MAAGLTIHRKRDFHLVRWIVIGIASAIGLAAGFFAYDWYINGNQPPLIGLAPAAYADDSVDESTVTLGDIESYKVSASKPRYITIPAIDVTKARIQVVSLDKLNTLTFPKNISDAAWFKDSALPGQGYGQAVIDGRSKGVTKDGIFKGLEKLGDGDKVIIELGNGKKITYSVTENSTESISIANTTGMQRLMKPFDSTKEGLGLVTTAGKWIPRDRVFNQRVLVRAVAD